MLVCGTVFKFLKVFHAQHKGVLDNVTHGFSLLEKNKNKNKNKKGYTSFEIKIIISCGVSCIEVQQLYSLVSLKQRIIVVQSYCIASLG